jgi:pimeloyl-ACP methyl ester carboxylesterase
MLLNVLNRAFRYWALPVGTAMLALCVTPGLASLRSDVSGELYTRPQQLVRLPDGRRLNLYCTGQGSPTVILEGGWTTETLYWRKVQPALSETSRVCSYDRAGYGYSDAGPMPRSASAIERDFENLLRAASIRGPIILVAHSIGALNARLFADRHREQLAGLVLLDPFSPVEEVTDYTDSREMVPAIAACGAAIRRGEVVEPSEAICLSAPAADLSKTTNEARLRYQKSVAYQDAALSEMASVSLSMAELRQSQRSWGDLPLVIVTSGETDSDPKASDEQNARRRNEHWSAHERVAGLSRTCSHLLLVGASHFIPMEHPEAVIEAVGKVRSMFRASQSTSAANH